MTKYPARTRRNCSIKSALKSFEQRLQDLNNQIWVVGRIIGILDDGFVLQDESGRMEVTNSKFQISNFKVGDIVEVQIAKGERIVMGKVQEFFKAVDFLVLVPCVEEFFIPLAAGAAPNYKRAIIDSNLMERLRQRQKIVKALRDWFWTKDFLEVETPQLVRLPGMEPYLDVFKTKFTGLPYEARPAKEEELFLITSPEYAMKKLLVAGYEKIFQLTKSFRNKEDQSNLHNPEFSILEWYRAYASYLEIMEDVEELVHYLATVFSGASSVSFGDAKVDVKPPWTRLKVKDAFRGYAGIVYEDFEDAGKLIALAKKKGYAVSEKSPYEDAFFGIFMNEIEPKLGFDKPVILYEYPAQMAALSKKCENDPRYSERFEVYIAGIELCNAFTELNDPVEQRNRLELERKERQELGKDDYQVDQSFIGALEFGLPPSGGIALGVDRLVMLLTDTADIRDIIFFPHRDL